jgi:hypothetical protein
VDPGRFVADEAFRKRVLAVLPRTLDPSVPPDLRDALLLELNQVRGVDFAASEEIEAAWGAAPRRSSERRVAFDPAGQRFDPDVAGRLTASVYSLPSFFFDAATAEAFLAAVRAAAPERTLVVLTDDPLRSTLAALARDLRISLMDTHGRAYSPWPRDPFSLTRAKDGGVRVLVRPNLQRGREEDAHLGPELVQGLPDEVDRAWGKVTWAEAPVPFHNGQVLLTEDAAWVTLHALEPATLKILGLDRVPVESFGAAAGIDRYVEATRKAADGLSVLYGRPVRFVHPLPVKGSGDSGLMRTVGGGAGYDLDSIVTFLPRGKGRRAALVADVSLGRDLLAKAAPVDLASLERGYGLEASAERLAAAQRTPALDALDGFLDLTAGHLATQGFEVRRLPILAVPVALLRDREGLSHGEFFLTWNNVVVETRKDGVRAEGFASLLPGGDAQARETFQALGVRLDLFPPLVRSVILNGGYRCASNHVRG